MTSDDHADSQVSLEEIPSNSIVEPPTSIVGIMKCLGPGLIIAGSIVGSGELIATTKTGAQAGISLLWLIVIGCVIKVFVQVELGRYTITHGETTLEALDKVPGPRARANWIVWFWLIMTLVSLGQLGGIVGGVGQAAAISFPFTGDYRNAIKVPTQSEVKTFLMWKDDRENSSQRLDKLSQEKREIVLRAQKTIAKQLDDLEPEIREDVLDHARRDEPRPDPRTWDDKIWASIIAVFTALLLYFGRYNLIQSVSIGLVVGFTFITVGNVVALQLTDEWHIPFDELKKGLFFSLPEGGGKKDAIFTALAAFGIIGVGAAELIAYPYWCLEKGYAKFTGPRTDDPAWAKRANGWMRVMRYDAFTAMVIYTVATIAFFLMGVAVLHREGLDPDGMRMVSTLATAYVPVFGEYARWLFLIGAIAVLYSTYMVANAGYARMYADGLRVFGILKNPTEESRQQCVARFSFVLPLICLAVFLTGANPVVLILASGITQSTMLPFIGLSALYFRYQRTDRRLSPGLIWDTLLILSAIGLLISGSWGIVKQVL